VYNHFQVGHNRKETAMINTEKFNQVVSEAKSKTSDAKWNRQIDRAAAGILDGSICVTLFVDGYALVTTPNNSYRVNGACHCKAAQFGDTKRIHRVAKKLIENYEEAACKAALPAELRRDISTTPRRTLIVEINACWPKTWPPLYTELLARFGKSSLDMLDDDQLRRVRLAIAM
jgi:hypothetical protein